MMEGFVVYRYIAPPKISIAENGLTFSKGVAVALDNPDYAQILINEDTKEIAIRAADAIDDWVFRFRKADQPKSKFLFFGINYGALNKEICELAGYDVKQYKYTIIGKYLRDENAVVFDLMSAAKA